MKIMKKNYYHIICAICVICGFSSCADFLEIKPQSEIILEDFWNEKADVDNVVAGCYSLLQDDGVRRRMMIWGEARSENVMANGVAINGDVDLHNILKENITAMNKYTTWDGFYDVINRCNTVLKYAPEVAAKDPAYTTGDLNATIAEVTALRSLCYFYLIRAFRDVPFSREAFTDDNQTMDLPATPFGTVLDYLIEDLEAVQDGAVKRYPESENGSSDKDRYQTGRITQDAIHAMLCELYLWKGDYDNCIRYADLVIKSKQDMEEEKEQRRRSSAETKALLKVRLGDYPLVYDNLTSTTFGEAYREIFATGSSKETVFELSYDKSPSSSGLPANSAVVSLYGGSTRTPLLVGSKYLKEDIEATSQRTVYEDANKKLDARMYTNCDATSDAPRIRKMASSRISINASTSSPVATYTTYADNNNSSSWIFYRLPDIMLMKAEALCEKMRSTNEETTAEEDSIIAAYNKPLLEKAFELANVVNKRSICKKDLTGADTLQFANYASKDLMTKFVKRERQRELMYEGKRWFDLVRYSLRAGNTDEVIEAVGHREDVNKGFVQNFFKKMDAIFWPYNIDEMKVNRNLVPNPSFSSGENSSYEKTN